MDPTALLVGGAAIPAGLALTLVALGRLRPGAPVFAALAISFAGFATLHHVLGWPNLPPKRSADYVFLIGQLGVIWVLLSPAFPRLAQHLALRALLSAALLWSLTVNLRAHRWQGAAEIAWPLGLAAAFAATWYGARRAIDVAPPRVGVIALGLWATASAVAIGATGSASLAQLAGGVAAGVGGAALINLFSPRRADLEGAVEVAAPLILMLLFSGSLFSYLPAYAAGLLAVSLLPLLRPGWPGVAASVALMALGGTLAVLAG